MDLSALLMDDLDKEDPFFQSSKKLTSYNNAFQQAVATPHHANPQNLYPVSKKPENDPQGNFKLLDDGKEEFEEAYECSKEELGHGSYAIVYRGRCKKTGKVVAVKVVNKELLFSPTEREALRSEVCILRTLAFEKIPNVIQMFSTYETSRLVFMVFELAPSSLEAFQKKQKGHHLDETIACNIFHQLVTGVHQIHQLGIVHGDIKPQNLLLFFDESRSWDDPAAITLKICDFGAARTFKEQYARGVVGTAGFIAPEVLQGKEYSYPVDLWSCGVVLYYMLYGMLPFKDTNDFHLVFPPQIPVSDEAKDMIARLICHSPVKRFTAYQALNHPWLHTKSDDGA